ncbi:hypothetical protein TNCV_1643311 [Trichonephila clavipes]|nr:hypothetical protein TNCV_1643311 [Trichonephila clavipes]
MDVALRNAPVHTALSAKQFLTSKYITMMKHPPYSPDLAPWDFFLISYRKNCLKCSPFYLSEEVQAKTENLLKGFPKTSFQNRYQRWQHRMQSDHNKTRKLLEKDPVFNTEKTPKIRPTSWVPSVKKHYIPSSYRCRVLRKNDFRSNRTTLKDDYILFHLSKIYVLVPEPR